MTFFLRYIYIRVLVYLIRFVQHFEKRTPPNPDAVIQIQSRDRNRTIKAHVYRPENPTTPSPVLLNFHGSGFIFHLHGDDDYYARFISKRTQYTVLDIQYRLGPENPFPAALNDIEDVVKFVQDRPELYDSSRLSIGGFSAGANLSLSASSMILPKDTFRSVLAFYPPADLATQPDTKKAPDTTGKVIPPWIAKVFDGSYFQDKDPRDPRISPFYAPAESFPNNVLIVTPAQDYLANEAQELAEKIRKDGGGKHVVSRMIEGQGHAWDKHCENGSEGGKLRDESYQLAVEMLGRD